MVTPLTSVPGANVSTVPTGGLPFTPGADISGNGTSTGAAQYVSSISFSAGGVGGDVAVNNSSTLNWTSGPVVLKHAGVVVLNLGQTAADYIRIGLSPSAGGSIRLDNSAEIIQKSVTAQTSPTSTLIRGAADDSAVLGGIGTLGLFGTVYFPSGAVDRNIVFQLFADNTQPTKDYISLGGPTAGNAAGAGHTAGTGFIRVPYGNFFIIEGRNSADNGDVNLFYTTPSQVFVGDLVNTVNANIQASTHILLNNPGFVSVLLTDNVVNVLTIEGAHNAAAYQHWDPTVTPTILHSAVAGPGKTFKIAAQDATGVGNNGGPLVFSSGASGSALPGPLKLQVAGVDVLSATANGMVFGRAAVPIVAGNNTLSTTIESSYLEVTGNLAGNATLILPAQVGGFWFVDASTLTFNAHTLTLQANGANWGTLIAVAGVWAVFYVSSTGKLWGWALNA